MKANWKNVVIFLLAITLLGVIVVPMASTATTKDENVELAKPEPLPFVLSVSEANALMACGRAKIALDFYPIGNDVPYYFTLDEIMYCPEFEMQYDFNRHKYRTVLLCYTQVRVY